MKIKMIDCKFKEIEFPTGIDDKGTKKIKRNYQLSETVVTNKQLYKIMVDQTLTINLNKIFNVLKQDDYPAVNISWHDAIEICNLITRSKLGSKHQVYEINKRKVKKDYSKKGYRLPTHKEWEAASRYIVKENPEYGIRISDIYWTRMSDIYWTPGSHASGCSFDFNYKQETEKYAVYVKDKIEKVKTKLPNKLGLYDMNGNVFEWLFNKNKQYRMRLGGCWYDSADYMQVGDWYNTNRYNHYNNLGLRLAKTL